MDKKELRRAYLEKRDALPDNERAEASAVICCRVLNSEAYNAADKICLYKAIGSEVDLKVLENACFLNKKRVFLPVMTGKHEMVFVEVKKDTKLYKNKYGIEEPKIKKGDLLKPDENTLAIVPGLIFGNNRYRIGYGGGYYDRFLSENQAVHTAGVCFDMQIKGSIAHDENDIPVNEIYTERRVIKDEENR